MADQFDRLTDAARLALTIAQDEALRYKNNYIGTEHLLLGLLQAGQTVAVEVLANLGAEPRRVRSSVESLMQPGDTPVQGEIGLTPRAKQIIELAVDEAHRLGHQQIGAEHLLLGMLREGEGIAAGVLGEEMKLSLEQVREEVKRRVADKLDAGEVTARSALVEMVVDGVRVKGDAESQFVLILRAKEGTHYLPIWIGRAEAEAIAVVLQNLATSATLTHDLLCKVITIFGAKVFMCVIQGLSNDVFQAKLVLSGQENRFEIDCRPSDAIAVAVRANAPIFAEESVVEQAGVSLNSLGDEPS